MSDEELQKTESQLAALKDELNQLENAEDPTKVSKEVDTYISGKEEPLHSNENEWVKNPNSGPCCLVM